MRKIKFIILIGMWITFSSCSTNIKNEENTLDNEIKQSENININNEVEEETKMPIETPDEIKIDIDSYQSINVIINKERNLPSDFKPDDLVVPNVDLMKDLYLRKEAANAIEEMFNAASDEGISLKIGSGFRSYSYQETLFNNYVSRDGIEEANKYSAKPGQSEHQTGLAADIASKSEYCYLKNCFKDTDEGIWLSENAYKYGFVLRFMEGKEEITGYIFEPWHYRYIGKEEAKKVYDSGKTLEEYYGLVDN